MTERERDALIKDMERQIFLKQEVIDQLKHDLERAKGHVIEDLAGGLIEVATLMNASMHSITWRRLNHKPWDLSVSVSRSKPRKKVKRAKP